MVPSVLRRAICRSSCPPTRRWTFFRYRRFTSESAAASGEAGVKWPLAVGGGLSLAVLGGGLALKSDDVLRFLHSGLGAAETGRYDLMSTCFASTLAQLPIDELKVSLLRLGALDYWTRVIDTSGSDRASDATALTSIIALLSGDEALIAFYAQPDLYACSMHALAALPAEALDRDVLQIFDVAATVASHPRFLSSESDHLFWEALLEGGVDSMQSVPAAGPAWGCVAARAAQRKELACAMIDSNQVKQKLMELAEGEPVGAGFSEEVLKSIDLQRDFAVAALHHLALAAQERGYRFVDDVLPQQLTQAS
eukprot:TRINITY_DN20988_c0_g1_i1.p1 TRINITY_DN20988_c0_g1~~TRINITY_DN20988_c0_g1_i1.p1  ORF type:complete len:310 (-),score=39.38 TRINITY_DN20988_c0_g1_i1:68-997(-)